MEKNPFLVPVIVLIAVVVVAVIVSVFIFWTFYSVNFNQANGSNQTNGNELSFNFQGDMAKVNVIAQNLIGKTVLITASATGLHRTNHQPVPA
jgi:flagellar basal body-associated protein FliL